MPVTRCRLCEDASWSIEDQPIHHEKCCPLKPTQSDEEQPTEDETRIESAVTNGYIEERRAKYLGAGGQWTSTFVGAFRINPPETAEVPIFDRIVPFEFFLWSDIDPQPYFDYVKKTIAAAIEVKRSQFFFETMSGRTQNGYLLHGTGLP